jgi:hypothetical protein
LEAQLGGAAMGKSHGTSALADLARYIGKQIGRPNVKESDAAEGCQRREPVTPDPEKIQEIKMG